MLDPLSIAVGAGSLWLVQYVALPAGRQVGDALYTDPPEQSDSGR